MKKILLICLLLVCNMICGCSQTSEEILKTETYIIPASYLKFTGTSASDLMDSFEELGDEFYTSVIEINDEVQIELTEDQLKNLVKRFNSFIDETVDEFLEINDMYSCVLDDNYKKISLYFDEYIPVAGQYKAILGIASYYGINDMLLNKTENWNVQVEIYNCHTNKLVVSFDLPDGEASWGPKEWEASYND